MSDQNKDKNRDKIQDAPLLGTAPDELSDMVDEASLPEITDGGRDPSRVPGRPGQKTPNLKPNDEQLAAEKEVYEGIDRAEDEQRRSTEQ